MRTVVVTDAGRGSAIAIIRSLGRAGWRVAAGDARPGAAGRFSRYTDAWFTYPDPRDDPEGATAAIESAVVANRADLLFPVTDDVILPLLDRRAELETVTTIALPGSAAVLAAADKAWVTATAERLGIAVPRTMVVVAGEATGDPELGWPVVVKPSRSRTVTSAGLRSHDVTYAATLGELRREVAAQEPGTEVLLQELVRGPGQGIELLAKDGVVLVAFQHRRCREYPPSGGPSAMREAVELDPVLLEAASALVAELRWTGLAMVEFKGEGTDARLMEVNGRVWGSMPLALRAGIDFPLLAARMHLGDDFVLPDGARVGTRSRSVELELRWAAASVAGHRLGFGSERPRRVEVARVIAALLSPRDGYDVQDLRDPVPGVIDVVRAVARVVGSARRH